MLLLYSRYMIQQLFKNNRFYKNDRKKVNYMFFGKILTTLI